MFPLISSGAAATAVYGMKKINETKKYCVFCKTIKERYLAALNSVKESIETLPHDKELQKFGLGDILNAESDVTFMNKEETLIHTKDEMPTFKPSEAQNLIEFLKQSFEDIIFSSNYISVRNDNTQFIELSKVKKIINNFETNVINNSENSDGIQDFTTQLLSNIELLDNLLLEMDKVIKYHCKNEYHNLDILVY